MQASVGQTHGLGLLTNAGLAALKLSVGTLAGSPALVADGVHSVSDVLMNIGAYLGWRWSERPRDADHHYGHGNGEALATLIVGLIIAFVGVGLTWSAASSRSHVPAVGWLGPLAIGAELFTIGAKFWLSRLTARRGREFGSPLLLALARDSRADMLTSTLVLIAIAGALAGSAWLEPVAAIAMGVLICSEGLRSAWSGLDVLMDRHTDAALTERVRVAAVEVTGVRAVDDLRFHPVGALLRIEMEIAVDGTLSVAAGHEIAHAVEAAVQELDPRIREVAVHVNPTAG